ncbi:MAG: hypothetical protein RBR21_11285 [Bacteroidales bacterium]|nr:hypothetical protein [Bacteroidales bacterium]
MKKGLHKIVILLIMALTGLASSCSDKPPLPKPDNPVLMVIFNHSVNGEPVVFDQMVYENLAGNPYLINEIQYFISEFTLHYSDGTVIEPVIWDPFHYVDTDLEQTRHWIIPDSLKQGTVDQVTFRLGICDALNASFMFVNPPERDMFWPEYLGGGYHYMKLNGKWEPASGNYPNLPFDFHVGRGQIYENEEIVSFVDNSMTITPAGEAFSLSNGDTTTVVITMQIENWFQNPHVYNHDVWGGYIMNNQEAMQIAVENSHDVFIISREELP